MKKMKCRFLYITAELVLLFVFAFVGNPVSVFAQAASKSSSKKATDHKTVVAEPKTSAPVDELDAAVRETSNYLNKQLAKGSKLIILNVQSDFPALSEYIIDELTANAVNDRVFSVVDRQQLNTIRAELDFQMSGAVDDTTAQSLGRMAGAQIIISGAVSKIGDLYRLRIRALSVQSAQIVGQFNRNIPNGPTVMALVNSKATGYSDTATTSTGSATGQASTSTSASSAKASTSQPTTYNIGDKGPAGGIIFYDKGNNTSGWRYLEASPTDLGKAQWQSSSINVGETKDNIGSGKQNTQLIGDSGRAALLCTQYSQGGYRDWFLPSKAELDLMYINLKMKDLGNFSNSWYWSSSQTGGDHNLAWAQLFSNGEQSADFWNGTGRKGNTYSVRACRQF